MIVYKNLGWICFVLAIVTASAVPLADNDALAKFLRKAKEDSPNTEKVIVKRRIFQDISDIKLKQISLRSLIGDVERDLFAAALNENKNITNMENNNTKNQPLLKYEDNSDITTTSEVSTILPLTEKLVSPITEKTLQDSGVPTHIVIDRIAIQPHSGDISFIPIFELKRTTNDEDKNKVHEITKITISKTEITSLAASPTESLPNASNTSIPTIEVPSDIGTTPKNIEQLKEAEEELKEKVAEIEAEPIILSARV